MTRRQALVDIVLALLLMALAFFGYYVTVLILRLRHEIVCRKLRALRLTQGMGAPAMVEQGGS